MNLLALFQLFLEAFCQTGVAAGGFVVFDGAGDGFFVAHQDTEVAGAGEAGVEEVALEHHVLAGVEHQHHGAVLRSLTFVNT